MSAWKLGIMLGLFGATSACMVDETDTNTVEAAVHGRGDCDHLPGELPAENEHGVATSLSTRGPIDRGNPFFDTTLGTNGRSCGTCHDPRSGWTISDDLAAEEFKDSRGLGPLFRLSDGGTRPDGDVSNQGRRKKTFEPITDSGLIRFGQGQQPATSDFEITAVADPYGFGTKSSFTRFRRPNPTSNERFVQELTWTAGPLDIPTLARILFPIAVSFHSAGVVAPDAATIEEAVVFQLSIVHAQAYDNGAGRLDDDGAHGGPVYLSQQAYFPGINTGPTATRKVFDIYDAWASSPDSRRRAIYRGQQVFNNKTFGPNNDRTCSGCHNTPNVGTSANFAMLRVGTDVPTSALRKMLPILTVRNKNTGEVKDVTDLGFAITSGLWADIGKFRVPHLRGLASRTPYFHDGRAERIQNVIEHYQAFFSIPFTGSEKEDLEAFLYAL